jgi:hypothetical protein
MPNPTNTSPLLDNAGKKRIQQIVGSFLYYARAVDPTILMALSDIATQQSAPTENTTYVSPNSSTTCGPIPMLSFGTGLPT